MNARAVAAEAAIDGMVDLDALRTWLDEQGIGVGTPLEVGDVLGGGTQNLLLRIRRGGREMVLRRGPRHLRASTNDNLRREMRVLAALGGTSVPHAGLVAACPDEEVLGGAAFYLMEMVDGVNPAVGLPWPSSDTEAIRRLCFSAVEALATIGQVDHEAVGLGDLGRPDGFLERQVGRWQAELASYTEHTEYGGPRLPGIHELADWLDRYRPTEWRPGILHGDFHLANLLASPTTADVVAVVDWEMATIGDPLLDLGWLLATWPDPERPNQLGWNLAGVAEAVAPTELVRHYAERSDRDLSAMDWYQVLAAFKLGIVLEGTYARSCAGLAPRDTGARLHAWAVALFEGARDVAGA